MNALHFTTDELQILIDALSCLKRERSAIGTWGARRLQGTKQTDVLKIAGGESVDADNLQRELVRELHNRTGNPDPIQRNNCDLVSESVRFPITKDQEATEAILRG